MRSSPFAVQRGGAIARRRHFYDGFSFDDFAPGSAWIKEKAVARIPALPRLRQVRITGELLLHPDLSGIELPPPRLEIYISRRLVSTLALSSAQAWEVSYSFPEPVSNTEVPVAFKLREVGTTNFLAWLGRVAERWRWAARFQRFRKQNRNRQYRIHRIEADGETVFDFAHRHGPYAAAFARKVAKIGLNVVGFFTADLGVGESARCMVRAAQAAGLPVAPIGLKLPCKASQTDTSFSNLLQETNPYPVNVFHLDAPSSADIDSRHGSAFRRGKHNIGYWAWELSQFPDAWLAYFDYFQEIWCPSNFVRDAIAPKSPLPVFTMPHAVEFRRPQESPNELRRKFGLPFEKYLFLFLYDLNSYSERKNPRAVVDAFRRAGLHQDEAALVVKVHGQRGNEKEFEALRQATADLPGTILLSSTLSRGEVYELEAACDAFVSLHRAEGFGFAPAECMYLGKPVISTDWSATAEFLDGSNGCPVRYTLTRLQQNHGPYSKGQIWADPDVDHAAEWMQRLVADRAWGLQLGDAARQTIESRFSPALVGARYRQRLDAIASW